MANCKGCKRPNEYQDQDYWCAQCKLWGKAETTTEKPMPPIALGTGNPWTLGNVRSNFKPDVFNPNCTACGATLQQHRSGRNSSGEAGFFDDAKAWQCPAGSGWMVNQFYTPKKKQ